MLSHCPVSSATTFQHAASTKTGSRPLGLHLPAQTQGSQFQRLFLFCGALTVWAYLSPRLSAGLVRALAESHVRKRIKNGAPRIFLLSLVLPFPKCHLAGIQHCGFQTGLLSLSNMHLRLLYVSVAWELISLLSMNNIWLYGCAIVYPLMFWRTYWLLSDFGNYN